MNMFIKMCVFLVLLFYAFIFIYRVPKYALFKAVIITSMRVLIVSFSVTAIHLLALLGTKSSIVALHIKAWFTGCIEEYCRTKWIILFQRDLSDKKQLKDLVLGVAFLYGFIEVTIISFGLFSNDLSVITDFIAGNLSHHSGRVVWPSSYRLSILLLISFIVRYYIHKAYLSAAVLSLIEKNNFLFTSVLLIHGFTNVLFIQGVADDINRYVYVLFFVQIIVICLIIFGLKFRKLSW